MSRTVDPLRLSVDPRQLTVLRVVVETGSITGAARQLHVSQPAVTATIQKLEATLEVQLLERLARGVRATDAGRRLAQYGQRIDALIDEALSEVTEQRPQLSTLILGASTTLAAGLVPTLIARFRETEGSVGVRLVVGNTSQILEKIRDGSLPLALVEGAPRAPGVRLERFLDDRLLPVVSSDLRLPRAALSAPILWREVGSGTRAVVERALRPFGRRPTAEDLELGSTEAILRAVRLSLGVGFLSRWSMAEDLAAGRMRVVAIEGLEISRRFSWAMPAAGLAGTASRFHELGRREQDNLRP